MTATAPLNRRPALLFGGLVVLIVFAEHIVTTMPAFSQRPVLPMAVAVDLLVGIPTLFYFLVVRRYGLSVTSLAGVAGASLALVFWLIPSAQQQPLQVLHYLPALLEAVTLAMVAAKGRRLVQAYREGRAQGLPFWPSLTRATQAVGAVGVFLLAEIDVLRYALLGGWAHAETSARATPFSNHQESGFKALAVMLGVALVVETAGLHLLVSHWSTTLASWLLFFDGYAIVTLIAHANAVRLLPTLLTAERLSVHVGSMWHVTVPRAALVGIAPLRDAPAPRADTLNLAKLLFTAPNLLLTFAAPVAIAGPYGSRRTARRVAIYLDQPQQFIAAAGLLPHSLTP